MASEEVSLAVRRMFFQNLNGNIIDDNGDVVPISDGFAPPENKYPYVILSSQVDVPKNTKVCKTYNTTILIDVVTADMDMIGRAKSEDISIQIENIILPDSFVDNFSGTEWEISSIEKEQTFDRMERNNLFYVYRKLTRYSFLASQK